MPKPKFPIITTDIPYIFSTNKTTQTHHNPIHPSFLNRAKLFPIGIPIHMPGDKGLIVEGFYQGNTNPIHSSPYIITQPSTVGSNSAEYLNDTLKGKSYVFTGVGGYIDDGFVQYGQVQYSSGYSGKSGGSEYSGVGYNEKANVDAFIGSVDAEGYSEKAVEGYSGVGYNEKANVDAFIGNVDAEVYSGAGYSGKSGGSEYSGVGYNEKANVDAFIGSVDAEGYSGKGDEYNGCEYSGGYEGYSGAEYNGEYVDAGYNEGSGKQGELNGANGYNAVEYNSGIVYNNGYSGAEYSEYPCVSVMNDVQYVYEENAGYSNDFVQSNDVYEGDYIVGNEGFGEFYGAGYGDDCYGDGSIWPTTTTQYNEYVNDDTMGYSYADDNINNSSYSISDHAVNIENNPVNSTEMGAMSGNIPEKEDINNKTKVKVSKGKAYYGKRRVDKQGAVYRTAKRNQKQVPDLFSKVLVAAKNRRNIKSPVKGSKILTDVLPDISLTLPVTSKKRKRPSYLHPSDQPPTKRMKSVPDVTARLNIKRNGTSYSTHTELSRSLLFSNDQLIAFLNIQLETSVDNVMIVDRDLETCEKVTINIVIDTEKSNSAPKQPGYTYNTRQKPHFTSDPLSYKNYLTLHSTHESLIEKLPSSSTPVIDAVVYCALAKWGMSIENITNFKLTDFSQFWERSNAVCCKPSPDKISRVKSLRKWFDGIPSLSKWSAIKLADPTTHKPVTLNPGKAEDMKDIVGRMSMIIEDRCKNI